VSKSIVFVVGKESRMCCVCTWQDAKRSGAPSLYLDLCRMELANANDACDCGRLYGGVEAVEAAGEICRYLKESG